MPGLLEPLLLDLKADAYITPAMTLADFEKAGPDLERLAQARK